MHAHYGFPKCHPCNCDTRGSSSESCENGKCTCNNAQIVGEKCDRCAEDHFNFPNCTACKCAMEGSLDTDCNKKTGDCDCKANITGRRCDQCVDHFFGYPNCTGR